MNAFIKYLQDFFREIPRRDFFLITVFAAALIALNYGLKIERQIRTASDWYLSLALFYLLYLFVLATAYLIHYPKMEDQGSKDRKKFLLILLLSPLFFAFKMISWNLGQVTEMIWPGIRSQYLALVLHWPLRLVMLLVVLQLLWDQQVHPHSIFGISLHRFRPKPYLLLLLVMTPVIAIASVRPDFLLVYPKLQSISLIHPAEKPLWPWKLLYEISYGVDFITIELFFRGLLVLGMLNLVGIQAILPMAAFYCTVHFGKPVGECVSSYFGGIVLGVIAYRTRTITGGLMVHLGIAWMMELGGWLGHLYINSR